MDGSSNSNNIISGNSPTSSSSIPSIQGLSVFVPNSGLNNPFPAHPVEHPSMVVMAYEQPFVENLVKKYSDVMMYNQQLQSQLNTLQQFVHKYDALNLSYNELKAKYDSVVKSQQAIKVAYDDFVEKSEMEKKEMLEKIKLLEEANNNLQEQIQAILRSKEKLEEDLKYSNDLLAVWGYFRDYFLMKQKYELEKQIENELKTNPSSSVYKFGEDFKKNRSGAAILKTLEESFLDAKVRGVSPPSQLGFNPVTRFEADCIHFLTKIGFNLEVLNDIIHKNHSRNNTFHFIDNKQHADKQYMEAKLKEFENLINGIKKDNSFAADKTDLLNFINIIQASKFS